MKIKNELKNKKGITLSALVITIIGGEFKEDTNNINNGYPILSWQKN